jgi:hypothetical protein
VDTEKQCRRDSTVSIVTAIVFIPIVVLAGIFFCVKFYELVLVAMYDPNGAFAVTPIVNYLLAGLGFLCMLGWAACNGMFHDIEQPKRTMLETEQRLDAESEPFTLFSKEQDRS